ncbi:MAG: hypothetical protein QOC92_3988, partial [Acidimicrobiaceae bacterium]
WTIRRTPYSPFVLKAMAPLPWKEGRCVWGVGGESVVAWVVALSGSSSISE